MNTLAFVLECAAVLALVGAGMSVIMWPLLRLLAATSSPAAALRAELVFVLGSLPGIAGISAMAAAAAPSLKALLLGAADHCAVHSHHLHLCIVHAAGLRPSVAAIGALFLALLSFRAVLRLASWREERALLGALEAMGTRGAGQYPVVTVPGSPWVCLSAGVLRPRIIVSVTLGERLDSQELAAALAHERAHLLRRDPLAHVLLGLSGLFALPFVARLASDAYRAASEEASDECASREVGDAAVVASALLKVASCRRRAPVAQAHAAFGEHALERRIRHLLDRRHSARATSWALVAAMAVSGVIVVAGLAHAGAVHHAVETLLHHVS